MSIKTITKITCFVILLFVTTGCSDVSYGGAEHAVIEPENTGFHKAEVVARIASKEINESSGLAVSKCQPDILWTHNDSGDEAFIYAIDPKGNARGKFRLPNIKNVDWEDIASIKTRDGECFLYIGEFGDNDRKRDEHRIYRLIEPVVPLERSGVETMPAGSVEALRFRYPAERHDAEALLIHPLTETIYVVTKEFNGPAHIYQIRPNFGAADVATAAKVAEISLPASPNGFVTGGDIGPDGKRVVLCDYYAGYELQLPQISDSFNDVWRQKPAAFDLGPRHIGEAVAYAIDGNTIFATTEGLKAPLIRVDRK